MPKRSTAGHFRLARQAIVAVSRRLRGIDPWKVVFACFKGRDYGDNPRCISERLHERCPEARIVWLLKPDAMRRYADAVPDYVTVVNYSSPRAYAELGTARVWVDNFTKNNLLRRVRGKQFYVQTWHGDRPVKTIAYDIGEDGVYRIEETCDRVLTGSRFAERMYRTAFRYRGEYITAGAPRNDILVKNDPADVARVRRKLNIPEGTRVLLYAPTYREDTEVIPRSAQMDMARTLSRLEEKYGCRWVCLFRAHYLSAGIDIEAVRDRVVDVTDYPDMSELMLASDMLITDYSTCGTDYILLNRPAIFYTADWDAYRASRRVYYDLRDTPCMTADSQAALEKRIDSLTDERVRKNCADISAYFGITETGHATDAACDYIIERLGTRKTFEN